MVLLRGQPFLLGQIGTFVVIGLLSIPPTIQFVRWSAAQRKGSGEPPAAGEVARARRFLRAEAVLFPLLPVFAAAMARGYGS